MTDAELQALKARADQAQVDGAPDASKLAAAVQREMRRRAIEQRGQPGEWWSKTNGGTRT